MFVLPASYMTVKSPALDSGCLQYNKLRLSATLTVGPTFGGDTRPFEQSLVALWHYLLPADGTRRSFPPDALCFVIFREKGRTSVREAGLVIWNVLWCCTLWSCSWDRNGSHPVLFTVRLIVNKRHGFHYRSCYQSVSFRHSMLTRSIQQSPSSEANRFSASQEIPLMEYITMCLDSTNKLEQRYVRHNDVYYRICSRNFRPRVFCVP